MQGIQQKQQKTCKKILQPGAGKKHINTAVFRTGNLSRIKINHPRVKLINEKMYIA